MLILSSEMYILSQVLIKGSGIMKENERFINICHDIDTLIKKVILKCNIVVRNLTYGFVFEFFIFR